ncbi:hypothetical protein [Aestuariivirga litoralis]|uniref:hypothetical protein n=1 Tax=Aestuariivirga litoralis TaxID=2650924 RepID=UPI0018C4F0E7|nr:hypothetical protein [Aestuariivirga litoralis]MBG1231878.1 hypothetical protein [Aestuariivirga litoralis]
MNRVFKIALAASLLASTVIAAAPEASAASTKHKWKEAHYACDGGPGVPLLIVGAVLGAATGGIGAGIAYGAAYAVGGAAIGAGAGGSLGLIHGDLTHRNCY